MKITIGRKSDTGEPGSRGLVLLGILADEFVRIRLASGRDATRPIEDE